MQNYISLSVTWQSETNDTVKRFIAEQSFVLPPTPRIPSQGGKQMSCLGEIENKRYFHLTNGTQDAVELSVLCLQYSQGETQK